MTGEGGRHAGGKEGGEEVEKGWANAAGMEGRNGCGKEGRGSGKGRRNGAGKEGRVSRKERNGGKRKREAETEERKKRKGEKVGGK